MLDCDPGHDDAIAIVAAAHHAELLGITTVAGNAPLDRTTYNACVLRDLIGDPKLTVHAGAVVFAHGGPLIQAPLDLTFQLQATPARIDAVRQTPGRLGTVLADLLTFFSGTYCSRYDAMQGAPVHDPCAVLALTHPGLFQSVRRHVTVETVGHDTAGMTVIDQRQLVERPAANTDVLIKLDADAVWKLITEAIAANA